MRILVFTDEYDYSSYTFIYQEIKELQKRGADVFVVCETIGGLNKQDDNFICIPLPANKYRRFFWFALNHILYSFLRLFSYYIPRKKNN